MAAVRYVPPGSRSALIEAIVALATDDALAARLSVAGRSLFEQHFTLGPFVDAMHQAYESIFKGTAGARTAEQGERCA